MSFNKKDIEKARETFWVNKAKKTLGDHITSTKQFTIEKEIVKQESIGTQLIKKSKKYKGFSFVK